MLDSRRAHRHSSGSFQFMKLELVNIVRWLCVGFGLVLIAFSLSLYRPVQMGEGIELISVENAEYYYYAVFIAITIASDTLFIAVTRWLLRLGSRLDNLTKILALMIGNVMLACLLVVVPLSWAWGVGVVPTVIRSGKIVQTLNYLAGTANSHQSFLATLAASNLLDGLVASAFFVLFFTLLLHHLIWPIVQRPVYALATRDVVRRRRVIRKIGIALVGVGALGPDAVKFIEKLVP